MKNHKKAGEFRYPEQIPERFRFKDAAIDQFLRTKVSAYFEALGDGNVAEVSSTARLHEGIKNENWLQSQNHRGKVTVRDWNGLTRYVGFKDD